MQSGLPASELLHAWLESDGVFPAQSGSMVHPAVQLPPAPPSGALHVPLNPVLRKREDVGQAAASWAASVPLAVHGAV